MKTKFVKRWLPTLLLFFLGWCFALPPTFCAPAGFFRVEKRDGVWWLIDPDGSPTLSTGVDEVGYAPDRVRGTGPSHYYLVALVSVICQTAAMSKQAAVISLDAEEVKILRQWLRAGTTE
ncbi:MAG: hypothetical protein ACYDA9_16615, partial [Terriglobia bacterium]